MTNLSPILISAVLTGVAGSAHCLGMCGGIGATLGLHTSRIPQILLYQVGRLLSYTVLGVMLGSALPLIGLKPSIPTVGLWLRWFTSLLIILVGLQLIVGTAPFRLLEKYGQRLWKPISGLVQGLLPVRSLSDAFLLGTLWGLLPCGLIYSALGIAITTANPFASGAVMLCFGIGTLPAMIGVTLFSKQIAQWLNVVWFRRLLGGILIAIAVKLLVNYH